MYDVIFDEKSLEYLEKLEKKVRKRIFEKIISTKEHPFRYFELIYQNLKDCLKVLC